MRDASHTLASLRLQAETDPLGAIGAALRLHDAARRAAGTCRDTLGRPDQAAHCDVVATEAAAIAKHAQRLMRRRESQ